MSDIIVLGIVLLTLFKMPDGELKHYDRTGNAKISVELRSERSHCDWGCKDLRESHRIHKEDRDKSGSELTRHSKLD